MKGSYQRAGRKDRARSKSARLLCTVSFPALALLALPSVAQAQDTVYWDPNKSQVNSGGNGDWNTATDSWSQSNSDVLGNWVAWSNDPANPDNAIFGTTSGTIVGTVNVTAPITVHNITFQSVNNWALNGGTITLAGTAPTITSTNNATINSVLAGTSGLTKTGAGTLTLTGNNSFSGGVTVNQGQLYLNGPSSFTGGITLSGGTLRAANSAAFGAVGNIVTTTANTTITVDSGTTNRTVSVGSGTTLTLAGAGGGSMQVTGSGNLSVGHGMTLSNATSNYTGTTTFALTSSGQLVAAFNSIGNLGEASSLGAPTTVANGTISYNAGQFADNVNYTGDGDSSNRNWSIALANYSAALTNSGTGKLTITGDIGILNSGAVSFSALNADMDLLGVISGGAGAGVTFGGGAGRTLTLASGNTFTGAATISGGKVVAPTFANGGVVSSLGAGSSVSLSSGGILSYVGGAISIDRDWTVSGVGTISNDSLTGALSLTGDATLSSGTFTFGGSYVGGVNTFSGVISGSGGLGSSGSGTWELTGVNTNTGTITMNGGTLRRTNASGFGTVTGVTLNGGVLDLGGFDLNIPTLSGTGGTLAMGSGNLTLNPAANSSFAGSITGSGGVTKNGLNILTLTGANSYSGPTIVTGGTLKADFSLSGAIDNNILSASSAVDLSGGSTLHIKGAAGETNSQTIGGLSITSGTNTVRTELLTGGTLTLNLGTITRTGGMVNFDLSPNASSNIFLMTTNADGALGGWAMIDTADYAKVVAGRIVAFDNTDYTDLDEAAQWDTLGAGKFVSDDDGDAFSFFGTVDNSVQLAGLHYDAPRNSAVTIADGQTLGIDGAILVTSNVGHASESITGGFITGSASGALGIQDNRVGSGTFTIASTIVDNGGPTAFAMGSSGTGRVALTGPNTYTGKTTLSAGTLQISSLANGGAASAIGASSAASSNLVLEGGTLHYNGATDAITDRGFTLVNASLGVPSIQVDAGRTVEFQGQVTSTDDQGLTKIGAGRLTLSNDANNYVGVTTVGTATAVGGTLSVDTLANGGLASGIGASSAASANLVLQNGGELEYTGGTVTTNRGFTLGAGGGGIDVTQLGTTLTIGGVAIGTGALTKNGAGTLILCGANTYSGGTTVAAGTLRACSPTAFGTWTMTVDPGATLDLANFSNTVRGLNGGGNVILGSGTLTTNGTASFSGTISGTGGLTVAANTQTMSGCTNSYTGATRIIAATLSVGCLTDGSIASDIGASPSGSGNLIIRDSGVLAYTGGNQTTNRGFTLESSWGYVDVQNAATTLTFTGNVVGPTGSLAKRGNGTLVLSGTNSYAGHTQVEAGILRAGSATAFGTGAGYLNMLNVAGATLDMNGFNASFAYLNGGGANGGNINLGSGTLSITSGSNIAYAGAISGTGNLIKSGNSGQMLTGCDSSYSGTTTISGTNGFAALFVTCLADGGSNSSIGSSGNDASNLIINGGTLRYAGTGGNTDRKFTLGASTTSKIDASGTGAIVFTSNGPIAFSASGTAQTIRLGGSSTADNKLGLQITNNGTGQTSLTKEDAGTWILTNQTSNYTGATTISGGVLGVDKLSNGGEGSSIGASGTAATNLTIGEGSTLRYTGTGDGTDRLFRLDKGTTAIESSGTGAVRFTGTGSMGLLDTGQRSVSLGGTYTGDNIMGVSLVDQSAINYTSLAKNGAGKWILTGTNTYTGVTNVNQGTLVIGNGATTGSIASTISNVGTGAVLGFNRTDAVTYGGTVQGLGSVQQLGTGTTIFTGANTYSGGTTISAGTLQLGSGGATGSIVSNVVNNGTLTFNRNNTYTFAGTISGTGTVSQVGSGTTVLTGTNSYGGGTSITAGTLQVSSDANLGAASGGIAFNGGTLRNTASMAAARAVTLTGAGTFLTDPATTLTLNGVISGAGTLTKTGTGTLTLAADNNYTSLTTISAGTLRIGGGGTTGSVSGNVLNNSALVFDRSNTLTYGGTINGGGTVTQAGSGTTVLTGANSYAGATNVSAGTLRINGNQSGATGLTTVFSGATLGGSGTVGGSVLVQNGGTLAPGNSPGVLTINGDLSLSAASILDFEFGQANVPGGPLNDLINVGGNLTLDGTINVTQSAGGSFGPGVYRILNYAGALTDNGLTVGTLPSGTAFVQTAIVNQVNLVNTAGLTLNFWDGPTGPKNDGLIQGGAGTWVLGGGSNDWTGVNGAINADYAQDSFAIFQGTGGAVTVDNSGGNVSATGMQFTVDGYTIAGGPLTLSGAQALVRTGDGSPTDGGITTTISAALAGSAQLVKDLGGTLVLSGANTYTGGTLIDAGTLRVSSDANLGDVSGGLTLDGGTLNVTASFGSSRAVNLTGAGTFLVDAGMQLNLDGVVTGAGAFVKDGGGTLIFTANNSYAGGTTISAGSLQLGNGGTTGSIVGDIDNNAELVVNRSNANTIAGTISGTGALRKIGGGTTILTADNSYTGGTTNASGILQLGNGGTTGGIVGNIINVGTLVFNRSNEYTFAGTIFGSGNVEQAGTGTTILTAANSYAGTTTVTAGTLLVNGDQSLATGPTSVATGATLGGTGTIGGNVTLAGGATLGPSDATGPGTLTINGNLALAGTTTLAYDFGQSNVVGGPLNDLTQVGGDLTLDGTIDVTVSAGGSFGPGLYRVISYGGILTDSGLALGAMPAGSTVAVQTSIAGQVNLINAAGGTFNFWDGTAPANESNNLVDGGSGTWQNGSGNNDWTTSTGVVSGPYTDGAFAIFAAASGTVSVDNSLGAVTASGLQFASDGYTITGQDLTLVGPQSTIRVGDGTALGLGYTATISAALIGSTQLVKADLGTLVLSGTNTYTGGTQIDAGTLRIASDANLGDAAGALSLNGGTLNTTADIGSSRAVNLLGTGTFSTDAGTTLTLNGAMSGAGGFTKAGTGSLVLTGANSFSGNVDVTAGSLFVNGDQSAAAGLTSVASGATLGGSGTIGGNVTLADGATLAAGTNNVGTLAINGNLALSAGSVLDFEFGQANTVGGSLNDLVTVGGGLTLDGTINVSVPASGTFGPGLYRVFNYGGALVDNGLTLGTMPGGSAVSVQTAVAGQVNLVNTAGLTLSFWDGAAGPKNNSVIEGGNGVWRVGGGSSNWTDASGALNADYAQSSFAIFSAAPGTVTVDNVGGAVLASGMQFASDGYVVAGGPLTLTGAQAIVQVGDGSVAGAGYTARIEAELTGTAGLLKTDAGALVLAGTNSYTGGTQIDAGMLQLGNGGTTGSIVGDVTNAGTLAFNRSDSYQFGGVISGSGTLAQLGAGTTILTADNGYTGGTTISAGTLQVGNGGMTGSIGTGNVLNNAALVFNRSNDLSFGGTISSTGTLTKLGAGTLTLTADNGYTGLTTVAAGTLQLGNGGATGGIAGDVLNNGTLTFNRTGNLVYAGAITGTGPVNLLGGGIYHFIGDSSYGGNTNVTASALRLAGGGSITTTAATTISGAGGAVTVTGAGSSLTTNTLRVSTGNDDSTLNIENGGLVRVTSTAATQIGSGTGSSTGSGIVNVTGAGSLFDVAGALALGAPVPTVSAVLNVTGGGAVLSDSGSIGYAFGGFNTPPVTVTVSGAGSNWTMANALNLRGGSISVLDGGAISAGSAQIGFAASDVLVSGAGSSFAVSGDATVGNGAQTTTVTLANGGAMSVGGNLTLANAAGSTGILNIGAAAGAPTAAGVLNAAALAFGPGTGTLAFNHTDTNYAFATAMSGAGTIQHLAGVTQLTGSSAGFTGTTAISGGMLLVDGALGDAASVTNALGGGTLGGMGTIGGDVFVGGGAVLAPGSGGIGTLTINGDLEFSPNATLAFEFGQANVPGGSLNDLVDVGGNLTLDGTIDVTQSAGGSFGPGVFRIINYAGTLTNNGLSVGTMPAGSEAFVQTVVPGQVNLVNTAGLTLGFWDGAAGAKNDGAIQGGTGTWRVGGGENNWTEAFGAVNADYAQDSFAIFSGLGGTVTIDNGNGNVRAAGMQFAVDGYTLTGGPLELTGTQAFVRVGDGSAGDAAITATIASALTGSARLVKDMGGTLILTGANSYTGGTAINGGTLNVSSDANLGDASGGLSFDGGTLDITTTFASSRAVNLVGTGTFRTQGTGFTLRGAVSGAGALVKDGNGSLTLTADNSYTGGTTINAGVLNLGEGGTTGSILGNIVNDGRFAINRSNMYTLTGTISGSGELFQMGTGTTILTAANSYIGATRVSAGTLLINGDQSAATGITSVAPGATLGGTGTIGGDVRVGNGTLAPGAGGAGTLTINGDLSMVAGSRLAYDFGAANAVGNPLNDLVNVGGNLTLDGTIDIAVTPGGAFDIGLYRIANYAGTLTNNGLAIGTMPAGAELAVQTSILGQVNLVNTGSAVLNFWDGNTGPKFNGAVNGGSGVWWATGTDNWTDMTGAVNASYDNGAFAVFAGASGLVTIDNSQGAVTASGLQFAASGGYVIQGGALTLTGPQSVIRVGDGTTAGIGYSATITSGIIGNTQLVKTDLGRLVLAGVNSYTGGTAVNGGTLRISSDANLGAASGGLSFNGGTLNTTADLTSARAVDLAGQGVFSTDAGTTLTLTGNLTGAGLIGKLGAGTLVLAGSGSHTGGMGIVQGTLLVNGDYAAATGLVTMNQITTLGGTGTIGGSVNLSGTLAPGAGGVGTLTIGGDLAISQSATLAYEFGQANVAGGALNDLVNVSGDLTLDGTINVTVPAGGAFDAGIYRVFNYGGTLTNNGLTPGILPGGSNVSVQTSIAGQVNLVNSAGLSLAFWDGAAGPKNNGAVNGGTGTWQNGTGNDNWTNANGTVNGPYSDGAFAVFGGTGGTVTVDNSLGNVTASGLQFAANGYTLTGNAVTLTGSQSTVRVGDGSTAGAGFTATINAVLSGATQLVKTDAGTLVLGGTNSYTGGTVVNGGTVQIASDANLGAAAGGVTLNGGTLATSANVTSARDFALAGAGTIATASGTTFTLGGRLTGTGAFAKTGTGTLVLTGDSSGYAGSTQVSGTLAVNGSLCGDVNVLGGGRLQGTGTVCTTVNAGTIAPGNSIGTLTVAGNYTGNGGTLEIEAELGGDTSPADRLVVTGTTSGTTEVKVINVGGTGAATVEGIKIVDVGGASNGVFTLDGDYVFQGDQAVIAGAYGYRLNKGGVATPTDGDWYLRSALLNPTVPSEPQVPLYQPGVPIYEAYGQALLTLTDMGTLQQRIGNRQWAQTESGKPSGIWGRMQSSRSRPNAVRSTSLSDVNIDSWKLELGADHVLSERSDGASLVLGVLGGYGEASASIGSIYGNGSIKTKGYSAGATITWFGPQGFYVDGRAQVTWFDSKLKSAVLGTLADGNNGMGQAYSLEVGKRSPVGDTLSVTPQIQMVYSTVGFDRFTDPNGAAVSSRLGDSLKTRWGLSLDRQDAKSHLYGVANLSYEWLDGTVTDVSGTPIARENHRLWGELGLGGSVLLGDRLTLFSEVSGNTAINDFGKSYSLKGTAGLRLAF